MSDNSGMRRQLEKIFGKICMIEELGIRKIPKSQRKKIKGYRKYDDEITYHHIKERHAGGKTTLENGALIKGYNHSWLHSLPEKDKEEINNQILEFKATFIQMTERGLQPCGKSVRIELGVDEEDCITIPVYDNTKKDQEKREKFKRAKEKRKTQRLIREQLDFEDDDYDDR